MNRTDLRVALDARGVSHDSYRIKGLADDGRHLKDLAPILAEQAGRWEVYRWERDQREHLNWFDNEADACEYMWQVLTRPRHSTSVSLTHAERSRSREITEHLLEDLESQGRQYLD